MIGFETEAAGCATGSYSVSAGLTDDSVLQSFGDAAVDVARKWHGSGWTPMGRMGTPADIGNVIALLCSLTPAGCPAADLR